MLENKARRLREFKGEAPPRISERKREAEEEKETEKERQRSKRARIANRKLS